MKICYLGGALEIGASSILVNLDGYNILMDSGIRQQASRDKMPDFSRISDMGGVDAIVISHAHMDHIGSLPVISKEYPKALIYMNKMTLDLMRVLLYDTLKIMNYSEGEIPLFREDDVINMIDRVIVVPYQNEIVLLDGLRLTLYMAGHIAGASLVYLKAHEGSVLYTGDYSLFSQHTISGLSIPKLRPDVVISEATYGDRLHANREAEEMRLVEAISSIIKNGGKVLIPAFALGRSQEVLLILKRAFIKGQIPKVNVYVDGMIRNINRVFLDNPLFLKDSLAKKILRGKDVFYSDNIIEVTTDEERLRIVNSSESSIIVASSGMLSGGMSEYYGSYLVGDNRNGIILTGYQDEESNGSMLLKLMDTDVDKRMIKLNGSVKPFKCMIDKVGLSAHADKQEIKAFLSSLSPRNIIFGHGDSLSIDALVKDISYDVKARIYVPVVGEVLDIDIKNPRKQVTTTFSDLFSCASDEFRDFYLFIKEHYKERLFTVQDLAYIYYGRVASEMEVSSFLKMLLDSIYFVNDRKRCFLFKINDEMSIMEEENKEITSQELEEVIRERFSDFPFKKISFYLAEKRVVLTFDFPRTIGDSFEDISNDIFSEFGILVEKNENINNLACENMIISVVGSDNIDKISYLPNEDKFRVKVYSYDDSLGFEKRLKDLIGYDVEFVVVARREKVITSSVKSSGDKYEINDAFNYIDKRFSSENHRPYKKSLKNGGIVLSFITYEIGSLYLDLINEISGVIKYDIIINKSPNINMIFSVVNSLVLEFGINMVKNPSFLPNVNKVSIKINSGDVDIENFKKRFMDQVGLELVVEVVNG